MDVRVSFNDSWSNRSRDSRTAHFVMNEDERTTLVDAGHHIKQNATLVFRLKLNSFNW